MKIFKYPCVVEKSGFKSYKGHSSHVTRVRFLDNDKYLISTGGLDKTNMIWRTTYGEGKTEEIDYDEDEFISPKLKRNKYGIEEEE